MNNDNIIKEFEWDLKLYFCFYCEYECGMLLEIDWFYFICRVMIDFYIFGFF